MPWQNITAVVLFERRFGRTRVTYVGLTGRPPLQDPGVGGQTRKKRDAMVIRHGDADVVTTIRPAYCWEPDRDRLAAAVSANAPHVSLQVVE